MLYLKKNFRLKNKKIKLRIRRMMESFMVLLLMINYLLLVLRHQESRIVPLEIN